MKTYIFILLALLGYLTPLTAIAQGENNVWAFGDSIGLDFNSAAPKLITTNILSWESSASVSNLAGELQFYCGHKDPFAGYSCVWDANHMLMPNGDSLIGNKRTSSSQGVTIVPFLDGTNKYYLFTQGAREDRWDDSDTYLRYSVIDMDLRGGLGDVVPGQKNIIVDSFVSEKLCVTKGVGCEVWLLTHRCDTNEFHAFKIDFGGVNPTPVISGFPSERAFSYAMFPELPYAFGNMDISADGTRIAASCYGTLKSTDLYDFNKTTGIVSNKRIIDSVWNYWMQFSPDGNKLYTTGPIAQYNLSLLPSLSAVKASKYIIRDTATFGSLRVGPDGRLYTIISRRTPPSPFEFFIYSINNPNNLGAACGFTYLLKLPSSEKPHTGLGPNIIIPPPHDTIGRRMKDTSLCFTPSATITADSGYNGYLWNDGSKGRNKVVHTAGTSWVKMRKGCTLYVDTFSYFVKALDTSKFAKDTSICFTKPITLNVSAPNFYRWDDGDTSRSKTIVTPGVRWYQSFPSACGIRIDTIHIKNSTAFDTTYGITDSTLCLTKPILLKSSRSYPDYLWSTGNTDSQIIISNAGTYWVKSIQNCAVHFDTFYIRPAPIDSFFTVQDTIICHASDATLLAPDGYTSYTWSNASTDTNLIVNQDGTYWVQSKHECSIRIDTFKVQFIRINTKLSAIDSLCNYSTIRLDATTPNATYLWQDASTDAIFYASKEGTYTVTISVGPCQSTQATTLTNKSYSIDIGADQKICEGETHLLSAAPGLDTYLWNDGSTSNTLQVNSSGQYWVKVQKGICIATDTIQVSVVPCSNCIAFPNAFTPNGDGKNDNYRPIINCAVLNFSFKVYNRYGEEVFSTNNTADKWQGTHNDRPLDLGVYFYFVKVKFDYPNASEELYKGDITLLR